MGSSRIGCQNVVAVPLYINDTPALSAVEFRSKACHLKMRHDVKAIIIDYLLLMTGHADMKNGDREQEEAFIIRALKKTAKELNVPIIVLSQLKKCGGLKCPQLSDLRELGVPIEYADIVAFIHRPEYYGLCEDENGMPADGLAEFIIAKYRNDAGFNIKLCFLKEQVRFADIDDVALPISTASSKQQTSDEDAGNPTCDGEN